jgi:hypothetical protein
MPVTFHPSTKAPRTVETYEGIDEARNPNDLFRLVSSKGLYEKNATRFSSQISSLALMRDDAL